MTKQEAVNALLSWWRSQIGYHEGANNYTQYAENANLTKLYGWKPQNQPWCDIAYDVGMIEVFGLDAASKLTYQPIGAGSALCRQSAQYYKDNGAYFFEPEIGDQIFFFYDGAINHTGIVECVENGLVRTIEGNTSDMVARRSYSLNNGNNAVIAGYGRPKWSVVADISQPVTQPAEKPKVTKTTDIPTISVGSTGEVVRAAQILLIGRGYTCGYFGADADFGNATRAAVKNFQRTHDLEVDGVIGAESWAALLGIN